VSGSFAVVARAVVRRWIEEEGLDRAALDAVADELCAALGSATAVIVDEPIGAALAVVDGSRAWCVGLAAHEGEDEQALLATLCARAAQRGASRLLSAGPPRWYLRSGLARGERERAWVDAGARVIATHVDLWVDPRGVTTPADGVERVASRKECEQIASWLEAEFSVAWAHEVRWAFARGAVFAARDAGEWVAVAAHSGHCAAAGTFGPLATRERARGRGHGARVARAALAAAAERGFARVCVPWVDREVVRLYEGLARVEARAERVLYAVDLLGR
jgi:hypothetical protein